MTGRRIRATAFQRRDLRRQHRYLLPQQAVLGFTGRHPLNCLYRPSVHGSVSLRPTRRLGNRLNGYLRSVLLGLVMLLPGGPAAQ